MASGQRTGWRGPVATVEDAEMVQAPSRRVRVRAATTQEIVQTARRLLVEQGSDAVSLRAIARAMGVTAPALYRYFGSHEELLQHVVGDIFSELAGRLHDAIQAAAREHASAGSSADELMTVKLIAACRAFRAWGLANRPEFGMIFGSPLPGLDVAHEDYAAECSFRFGQVFLDLFLELWRRKPFPVPADASVDPSLRAQLARYRQLAGADLPLGALQTFLRCWVLLYGTVSLEVFGHMRFALTDSEPLFELVLADLASLISLQYPLPG